MSKIIGIDLGTTNSAMAVMEAGKPTIIPNVEGGRTTPSMVAINKKGERLVGLPAKRQMVVNKDTIFSAKRLIGRKFEDKEVQRDIDLMPYKIKKNKTAVRIEMDGKDYAAEEISAMVLSKLKSDAEKYLGVKVTEAVITVPAYFNDSQRKATKDAGKIAGLEVKRIINEPTAAALAYGLDKKDEEKVIVYDLGGGTFDVSILELGEGVFEVKSTSGDTHLGGDDFDLKIMEYLVAEFKNNEGIDISSDKAIMQRIKEATEKAKIELSSTAETEINLPFLTADDSGPKHMVITLSRSKLNELVEALVDDTLKPIKQALVDAKLKKTDIDEIILVGGMTRMPLVQDKVKEFFGKEPLTGVNPDEVVAIGAAIQGGVLAGDVKDVLLLDVTPLSLGIETLGGVATKLIEKNTTVPTSKSQVFSTAADNQPAVDVNVVQGEREMAEDNKSLGMVKLDGIPPAPRGIPQIEVTFDIDANGILNVTAKDKGTNKEQKITIEGSSSLDKDEIEKMQKDAELHAEEDKEKRALADTLNNAMTLVSSTEKSLSEYKEKLDEDTIKGIEEAIEKTNKAIEANEKDGIDVAVKDLSEKSQKLGEMVYKDLQDETANKEESDEEKTDEKEKKDDSKEDAVEGEVVEDDKK